MGNDGYCEFCSQRDREVSELNVRIAALEAEVERLKNETIIRGAHFDRDEDGMVHVSGDGLSLDRCYIDGSNDLRITFHEVTWPEEAGE
jgi:hypothetical protein